jgi:hypothetical protein
VTVKINRNQKNPKLLPKKNPLLWVELLKSISSSGHTSGPTSQYYIQGYQAVFQKWGIFKGRNIDLKLIDRILNDYGETRILPAFKP